MKKGFELWLFFKDTNGNRVYPDTDMEESFILENYPVLPRVSDILNIDIGYAGLEPFRISEGKTWENIWDWYKAFLEKFDSSLFKVSEVQLDYYNPERSAILFLEGRLKSNSI